LSKRSKIDYTELERFYNTRDPEYWVTIEPDLLSDNLKIEVTYKTRPVITRYMISYAALDQALDQCDLIEHGIDMCHKRIQGAINKPLNGLQKMKMRLKNGSKSNC
jgi:hypothetical protein